MAIVIKEFHCEKCDNTFEDHVKHTVRSKKCPTCKTKCESLISLPSISKMGGPRTVGALMEQNNKKNPLSKEKALGSKEDLKKMEHQKHMKDLARMTPEQTKRYIETGKK